MMMMINNHMSLIYIKTPNTKIALIFKKTTNVNKETDSIIYLNLRVCPRGVMVKAMDCGIIVSDSVLQSRYYVHKYVRYYVRKYVRYYVHKYVRYYVHKYVRYYVHEYPWERYEPTYPPSYGFNSTTTVLLGE